MSKKAFQIKLITAGEPTVVCRLAEAEEEVVAWAHAHGYRFSEHRLMRKMAVKSADEFATQYNKGAPMKVLSSSDAHQLGTIMKARQEHLWTVVFFDPLSLLMPAFLFNESSEFVVAQTPREGEGASVFELLTG